MSNLVASLDIAEDEGIELSRVLSLLFSRQVHDHCAYLPCGEYRTCTYKGFIPTTLAKWLLTVHTTLQCACCWNRTNCPKGTGLQSADHPLIITCMVRNKGLEPFLEIWKIPVIPIDQSRILPLYYGNSVI